KHATKGKKIVIDSKKSDQFLTINVKDSGTTIPEEHRQKVFDRTHQIDDKKRGRGLGLSIVDRIADAHNAEVGVKPNEPVGNIFYIKIPNK
ncbi:MAG: ATP-binding protein, partial [Candidatus Marinimicrobia bacterium]|nr:ATP-binding protein [Candidatus Neomarinimicrobiota bacterium]